MNCVSIITMGCRANGFDSAVLADQLKKHSFKVLEEGGVADAYIINSCSVTERADAEVAKLVRRSRRANQEALILITGCSAQVHSRELSKLKGVHYIVGNSNKGEVIDILLEQRERPSRPLQPFVRVGRFSRKAGALLEPIIQNVPQRRRAFLKVQDGCEEYCSFCIIPFTRGPSRSRPLKDIVGQVHRFAANGYAEVVLTGIHLGAWGEDLKGEGDLLTLLKAIIGETDLPRLRISSIEPMQLSENLLDFWLSQERISSFLHLSIQSGDNEILRRMRRRYRAEHCRQIVERFVQQRTESYIGFDLIVGFPGETEAHFGRTLHFLESTPWARLHAFPFSPRPLTAAARYPDQVSEAIVHQHMNTLLAMSEERFSAFQARHIGATLSAIPIGNGESSLQRAVTDNYLTVYFREKGDSHTAPIQLQIEEFTSGKLFGKIVAG